MMPDKTRYFLFLSYRGTNFHGWQIQPTALTVQKTLDTALSLILNEEITTTGAGRTDAGVHALTFCAHFDSTNSDLSSDKKLIFRLNRILPKDIAIISVRKVIADANARFSAISRTYKYYISKEKDPFSESLSWLIHRNLNIERMNQACKTLAQHNDFTSFSKLHSDTKTNLCRIYNASWSSNEESLVFLIRADRFLRNMVRAIVGTMVDIGIEKLSVSEFEDIILAKDRCKAGKSAPAQGLFLTEIEYPDEIFI